MEERLLKLLDLEQLSSSKFADLIGVQRSSVSHILSGRNKPSFDFLQKTLRAFPMISADWLILGEGKMYEGDAPLGSGNLFQQEIPGTEVLGEKDTVSADPLPVAPSPESVISANYKDTSRGTEPGKDKNHDDKHDSGMNAGRKLRRVIMFYSDNSFESFDEGR